MYYYPRSDFQYHDQRFFGFGLLPFLAGGILGAAVSPLFFRPPPYPIPYPVPYPFPSPYPVPYGTPGYGAAPGYGVAPGYGAVAGYQDPAGFQ
ncbi:hypothetical protein [Bacillus sp. FJAT-29790]|uniref:hypothetical protein n=1 Tax=Bacillus sp. FJAT-29790 TaxID=1895002 RepID=UPI00349F40A9